MKLLNIGCGSHFHPSWFNIDLSSASPGVIPTDIRKGLPFGDNIFDAVYHSHLLEHLTRHDALGLLKEAVRVLKLNGIMRVVTPDLESIARLYLEKLELASRNAPGAEHDYDWLLLELYDQAVRNEPGGEMAHHLKRADLSNREFILSRIGDEAVNFWNAEKQYKQRSLLEIVAEMKFSNLVSRGRDVFACLVAGLIAGAKGRRAFQTGVFRASGEIHLWMYDRYSLKRILELAGLVDIKLCRANESDIPNFTSYGLDVVNGRIRKPDSLFMEGAKR